MAVSDAVTYIIKETPLPPAPETHDIFDPCQWATLLSIADAIIPSIRRKRAAVPACHHAVADKDYDDAIALLVAGSNDPDRLALAQNYLEENAVAIPAFKESLCRTLALYVPPEARSALLRLLTLLNHRAFALPLTGSTVPFRLQPVHVRDGCGAGVAAKNLAEAGYRVVVAEKSYYFSENHYPMTAAAGTVHLYANGGAEISDDGSISVLSGSTWGGGGTINWSASLQTQSYVRKEWAKSGLDLFTSMAFQDSLDRVCDYMGASTDHIEHNFSNSVLLEGARKLGYNAKAVPQNTGNQKHYCGYCTLGCASATKQGPAVSFLADAARAGATFIEGLEVDKVRFDTRDPKRPKVAVGVKGTWRSRDANGLTHGQPLAQAKKLIVKAKKVIISCGSLQSPLLLLRSGLKNSHIGRNLHLHPVMIVGAIYDHETRPWEGGILTSVVSDFENVDGTGHGTKIEALTMMPSFFLPSFTWKNGLDYKLFAANLRNMSGFISLARDRDTGSVYPDPVDGRCRIKYTPSAYDRKHILEGVIASAKIAYVSGAKEIRTTCHSVPPFVRPKEPADSLEEGINNPAFQAWIQQLRQSDPLPTWGSSFASAHQMGTCRMGSSARKSVVDPSGQVWGTDGLYVMDASVFPSASGVNPMVTNMAITDWTSRRLVETMKKENALIGSPRFTYHAYRVHTDIQDQLYPPLLCSLLFIHSAPLLAAVMIVVNCQIIQESLRSLSQKQ
ncbi:long chain fatty alcohol oxidase [Coccidioides immitis H538.4]|uniref:Long chain fatty alcohol oxidase n=1 Tax=Coccidioides immitis H538.4 TaxID=396776 RepID=A0A0J8RE54_COCIT|nr:long chain fatty alcohol oxidase [Coccidioides immitis H538.4]